MDLSDIVNNGSPMKFDGTLQGYQFYALMGVGLTENA